MPGGEKRGSGCDKGQKATYIICKIEGRKSQEGFPKEETREPR